MQDVIPWRKAERGLMKRAGRSSRSLFGIELVTREAMPKNGKGHLKYLA
jgi:hypothetical protein